MDGNAHIYEREIEIENASSREDSNLIYIYRASEA